MRRLIMLSAIVLLFAQLAFSLADNKSLFSKANKLYVEDKYNEAIDIYHQIENSGLESFELYFNLGCTYYRMKNIPYSILYLERAKRLNPFDEDVEFNLNVANLRVVDKINPVPRLFVWEWIDSIKSLFNSDLWSVSVLIFVWGIFLFLVMFLTTSYPWFKKLYFAIALFLLLLTAVSFYFAYSTYRTETSRDYAVIYSPSVFVRSSPEADGTKIVTLHEGTKVSILDTIGKWKKIRIADGNTGWVEDESILII